MKIKNDVIVISDDEDGDMGDIINSVISSKYYTVNDKGVVVIDDSENECPVLRQGNSQDGTNLLRVDANEESCSTNSPASSTGAVQAEENSLKRKINGNDEHEETEEGGSRIKRARKGRRRRGRGCGSPENLEVEASTSTGMHVRNIIRNIIFVSATSSIISKYTNLILGIRVRIRVRFRIRANPNQPKT